MKPLKIIVSIHLFTAYYHYYLCSLYELFHDKKARLSYLIYFISYKLPYIKACVSEFFVVPRSDLY